MADVKISALAALTGANTATDDLYVVVDSNVPETKKQTRAELFQNVPDMATSGTFVHNEAGADKDARFEGDTDQNLLFTDASTDRVGVGTSTPVAKFQVNGSFATYPPVVVSADYVVTNNDFVIFSFRNATNTITLPAPATSAGRLLWIVNKGSGGNAGTVVSASSNVILLTSTSTGTAILPAVVGSFALLISNGADWYKVAGANAGATYSNTGI
jgi:hypothetical protein